MVFLLQHQVQAEVQEGVVQRAQEVVEVAMEEELFSEAGVENIEPAGEEETDHPEIVVEMETAVEKTEAKIEAVVAAENFVAGPAAEMVRRFVLQQQHA